MNRVHEGSASEGEHAVGEGAVGGLRHDDPNGRSNEIVIGIVGPVGTDTKKITQLIEERLRRFNYAVELIKISEDVIPLFAEPGEIPDGPPFERRSKLMDVGNRLRKQADNSILAKASMARIAVRRRKRQGEPDRIAYVVSSFKHPDEVAEFRKVYGGSFYLFAVHADASRRGEYLAREMMLSEAVQLITRDEHEDEAFGQHTRDTFHLADFFLADERNDDKLRYSMWRCLDLIFGKPTLTPTFNEFAMFMAFAASLRSADLSRQVGAVIAKDREILSTGANDCPSPGGGLYWPAFIGDRIDDVPRGRDYKRGHDSNATEKKKLIEGIEHQFVRTMPRQLRVLLQEQVLSPILEALASDQQAVVEAVVTDELIQKLAEKLTEAERASLAEILTGSGIKHITEYGRVVHAEMEAILACARNRTSCRGATIFCTTFPCHNCAKHIIAAGIEQVIYVEPYPKSKAIEFHDEAVSTDKVEAGESVVRFKPFIGVAPRRFFDLFSMRLSSGRPVARKSPDGATVIAWEEATAVPRVQMLLDGPRKFEFMAGAYIAKIYPEALQEAPDAQ